MPSCTSRCFLSLGGGTLAGSPVLRLVFQVAKHILTKWANKKFPLFVLSNHNFMCTLKVKIWQPGSSLPHHHHHHHWGQRTWVEGGRGPSFTKAGASSNADQQYDPRLWGGWQWPQLPEQNRDLGPSVWDLAKGWQPSDWERPPCSCCRPSYKCGFVLRRQIKSIR